MNFEEYLEEQWWKQGHIKDEFPNGFNDWLGDLDTDELIEHADKWYKDSALNEIKLLKFITKQKAIWWNKTNNIELEDYLTDKIIEHQKELLNDGQ